MNKVWFVFKNSHHTGPFSLEELEALRSSGSLKPESLVWKEGAKGWMPAHSVSELAILFESVESDNSDDSDDGPPPLPPSFDDGPPPIPLEAILQNEVKKSPLSFEKISGKKSFDKNSFSFLSLIGFFFVFAFVLVWFFKNEYQSQIKLNVRGIMPVYLEKLQEVAQSSKSEFHSTLALSLDGKILYASSNIDGEILTIAKLKSIQGRTLSQETVELSVRGVMKERLARFDKMYIESNKEFVPGDYEIEVIGRKIHFLNRHFKFLSNFDVFRKLNQTFRYKGIALIYAGTPREFEKKLEDFKSALKIEKMKPFQDKVERLQTFKSLLERLRSEYIAYLAKIKTGKEIRDYEKFVIKEISPVLQPMIVAALEMSKSLVEIDQDQTNPIAPYKEQVQLGKEIGELSSELITKTQKIKKISQKDKESLTRLIENRYRSIKLQLDLNLMKIEDQVQKI